MATGRLGERSIGPHRLEILIVAIKQQSLNVLEERVLVLFDEASRRVNYVASKVFDPEILQNANTKYNPAKWLFLAASP